MTYDTFSAFYDQAMQDYSWCDHFLHEMIDTRLVNHDSVLELGCGTGRILELIGDEFERSAGLDISPAMLGHAKERLPDATFYEQDMRDFTIPGEYDLIYCLFDSLNHLQTFPGWVRTFNRMKEHLSPEGLCIFDMNTPERLGRLALFPPVIRSFGEEDTLIMDVVEDEVHSDGTGLFHFDVTIFKQEQEDTFTRYTDRITEFAPTAQQVIDAVTPIFPDVKVYDEDEQLVDTEIPLAEAQEGRLFFVCGR